MILRIAAGLLFTVDADGSVFVWQPKRRERTRLEPALLQLLLHFGEGATAEDAAEAAGIDFDDAAIEAVALLRDTELLVPVAGAVTARPPDPLARARIDELVDRGSFDAHASGAIVAGFAKVDGRDVAIAAWEPFATSGIDDVLALQERVLASPRPLIYLLDTFSIGREAGEFVGPHAIGRVYANQARLSGIAPQLAIVAGALWRPAALLPVGCDAVIFVSPGGSVSIGDRSIVREFTGADLTAEELGGARMHAEHSGLAHLIASSTRDAAAQARRYLGFLARTGAAPAPAISPAELDALVPDDADAIFPIEALTRALADEGSVFELRAAFAPELQTSFARIEGVPIGVIANACAHRSGVVTADAADKAARFALVCSSYGLPVLFLVDVLGLAIGRTAEREGVELAAGRVFSALANLQVPKLTLVVRRAHTAGFFVMSSPAFDPELFLALPTASISIVSERAAVGGVASLERHLDAAARESLRNHLRAQRAPIDAPIVRASEARSALAAHLRAWRPGPRARIIIPP